MTSYTSLYYVHDPMCSWCWAFLPTWHKIRRDLPTTIRVQYVLGGLAPDTGQPMPLELQQKIQGIWETIKKDVPGTEFNFDFWTQCQPRRATYPACRAVIAVAKQKPELGEVMIEAIQCAYYLQARNPSDDNTLIALAIELELDEQRFRRDLNSPETQKELLRQIEFSRAIGARSFPSLVLRRGNSCFPIAFNYNDALAAIGKIKELS